MWEPVDSIVYYVSYKDRRKEMEYCQNNQFTAVALIMALAVSIPDAYR